MKNKQYSFSAILIALFSLLSLAGHAQLKVGIRGGLSLTNVSLVNEENDKQNTEALPRFQIGLTLDIPLVANFYLQPAVLYAGKGYKQDGGWLVTAESEFKAKPAYVEVPVNLLYKPQLGTGNLLIGAGPYLGYGIGGKWETNGRIVIGDIVLTEKSGKVLFKNDWRDGEFGNYLFGKPWDYGVNLVAGYEFLQHFTAQFNAQFGLANLTAEIDGISREGSTRNKGYGISVGYRF